MISDISKYFSLREFTESDTAKILNIDNTPNQLQISRLQSLCDNILDPLRIHYNRPIRILSGFRSEALNKAIGGAPTSQHTLGEAADIHVSGVRNDDLWQFIVATLNFDQVIAEKLHKDNSDSGWVHVSHKLAGKQRGEALSFLGNGNYVNGLVYI